MGTEHTLTVYESCSALLVVLIEKYLEYRTVFKEVLLHKYKYKLYTRHTRKYNCGQVNV